MGPASHWPIGPMATYQSLFLACKKAVWKLEIKLTPANPHAHFFLLQYLFLRGFDHTTDGREASLIRRSPLHQKIGAQKPVMEGKTSLAKK